MPTFKKKKIFFFNKTSEHCKKEFDSFVNEDKGVHGKNGGILELKKAKEPLEYDSGLEKEVLKELNKCSFIKEIKTQSVVILFPAKFGPKMHKYIPDIQLLYKDNKKEDSIVIIEVKPFKEMVNSTVLRKNKALRKYCKEKGYGHAIVDIVGKEFYTFEDLKKEKVSTDIQKKFIEFVAEREKVTFTECKQFRDKYNINEKQICHIIWRHKYDLKYQQNIIIYKKKKHIKK